MQKKDIIKPAASPHVPLKKPKMQGEKWTRGPIRYQCEKVEGKTKTFSLQNLKLSSLRLRRQKTPKNKTDNAKKKGFRHK